LGAKGEEMRYYCLMALLLAAFVTVPALALTMGWPSLDFAFGTVIGTGVLIPFGMWLKKEQDDWVAEHVNAPRGRSSL